MFRFVFKRLMSVSTYCYWNTYTWIDRHLRNIWICRWDRYWLVRIAPIVRITPILNVKWLSAPVEFFNNKTDTTRSSLVVGSTSPWSEMRMLMSSIYLFCPIFFASATTWTTSMRLPGMAWECVEFFQGKENPPPHPARFSPFSTERMIEDVSITSKEQTLVSRSPPMKLKFSKLN